MPINDNPRLQEAFSLAVEDRSRSYADLVAASNVILHVMKENDQFQAFSGPSIRETLLYDESGTYKRYAGYDYLIPTPKELFGDAEFLPKMAAVSVVLSNEEILKNSGSSQIRNIMKEKIKAGERELKRKFVVDVHSDGTLLHQIGGLQMILPTNPALGTYGGISRVDNENWRPGSYDAHSVLSGITQVTSTTVKRLYDHVVIRSSLYTEGPNLICAAEEHFQAFSDAVQAIQRINDENKLGKLGFSALKYYGAGKSLDVVLEGGQGTAMPANVTYFLDTSSLKFRFHPDRNFTAFGGKQMPINQDAVIQHIGFMGNLTMNNPRHMAKLYDSNTGA